MEIANFELNFDILSASLHKKFYFLAHTHIHDRVQADELSQQLAVHLDQDIAFLKVSVAWAIGQNHLGHKHASFLGELRSDFGLPLWA